MAVAVAEELQTIKPTRFGRYILLDRIGVGGMAEVFRAVMPGPGGFKRTFVVKRILTQLCQSPTFVEMFVREARIGALLNHPNIAQVYDFGNVDGEYFLAMEYVRGGDVLALMRRLREAKQLFPVPVAAFVAQQVATGLAYAHALCGPEGASLDLIHRDVTPSNIMCMRTGGVKLLDFGIAKTVDEAGIEPTEQGSFRGKLAYMAPERVRNEPFDARSDLYSLGVVLWEMLTGKRLFRGANDLETLRNVLEMPVPPPSSRRTEVPAGLDRVVARALARDARDRYPTAQALADDLEPVLAETKFQSRMVAELLAQLHGSGTHSSQIALAYLTPELLASFSEEPPARLDGSLTALAAGAPLPMAPAGRRARLRRIWGAATAGTVAVVVVIGILLGTRGSGGSSQAATASDPTVTVSPAPPPATTPPTAARAEAPSAQGQDRATGNADDDEKIVVTPAPGARGASPVKRIAATKVRTLLASQRPAAAKPRSSDDAIAGGRSIDPFAEAAQRGRRR